MNKAMKIQLSGISSKIAKTNELELNGINSVSALKEKLISEFPELGKYIFHIAVNSKLSDGDTRISEKDEILVFGAFAGG
jgi:molybdopterin converting factor small subunit